MSNKILLALLTMGMLLAATFSGCIGSNPESESIETETDVETDTDVTNETAETPAVEPTVETVTLECGITFSVSAGGAGLSLPSGDDSFESNANCKGIIATIDGGGAAPTATSYQFRIADSEYDGSTGTGGKYWEVVGTLPMTLKISEKDLKKYSDGEGFQTVLFVEPVAAQETFTITVNLYYGAPPS
ncbi:MAG: hypothetical protein CVT48_05975 [Thermoplasmata archaeon HGW-Thermoplasmata-1]|nr:MAG: hypothetical protein CVT48_05975 [Thermoplasmata archaeon HGW-Thermoplasmata-1]